jgi:hypothetical protein
VLGTKWPPQSKCWQLYGGQLPGIALLLPLDSKYIGIRFRLDYISMWADRVTQAKNYHKMANFENEKSTKKKDMLQSHQIIWNCAYTQNKSQNLHNFLKRLKTCKINRNFMGQLGFIRQTEVRCAFSSKYILYFIHRMDNYYYHWHKTKGRKERDIEKSLCNFFYFVLFCQCSKEHAWSLTTFSYPSITHILSNFLWS